MQNKRVALAARILQSNRNEIYYGGKKGENVMTEETMLMLVPVAALAIFAVALLFAVGFSKGGKVLGKHNKTLQNMMEEEECSAEKGDSTSPESQEDK